MIARSLLVALLLAPTGAALAQEGNPLFKNQEPTKAGLVIKKVKECGPASDGRCRDVILAKGDFTQQSGGELSQALREMADANGQVPTNIYLDSPGGVLTGALGFGAVVRSLGLNTVIGEKMECFSACAYAFLGGVSRTVEPGGQYGVHRFFAKEDVRGGVEMSQQTMALLSSFVENMGASPNLVRLSASAGQRNMVVLTPEQLKSLRIDNTFPTPKAWSIQTSNDALEMTVSQHSAFNDRLVNLTLSPQAGQAKLTVAFQEPKAFSVQDNKSEMGATPSLSVCRVDLRTQQVRKCINGKATSAWSKAAEERTFVSHYSLDLNQISQLVDGSTNERIIVSVIPEGRKTPIVLVATSSQGFATAFRAVSPK